MWRTLRIYRRSLGAHLRSVLEYEADFWILILAGIFHQTLNLIFMSAVFAQVPTLNGWSYPESVLLVGVFGFIVGLSPLFFEGIWRLAGKINRGELDYPLVRPAPVPVQIISGGIGLHGIGDLLAASGMMTWALLHLDVRWSPATIGIGLLLFAAGAAVHLSLVVLANTASFWIGGPHPFLAVTVNQVGSMARYPISIFSFAVRAAFTVLLPVAFIGFFPVSWLLGKENSWIGLLTPLVAAYCVWLARTVFRSGLLTYESAGH